MDGGKPTELEMDAGTEKGFGSTGLTCGSRPAGVCSSSTASPPSAVRGRTSFSPAWGGGRRRSRAPEAEKATGCIAAGAGGRPELPRAAGGGRSSDRGDFFDW